VLTEKELLKLAGKLAITCDYVLQSNPKTLSNNIKIMEISLMEYNNAIIDCIREEMESQ